MAVVGWLVGSSIKFGRMALALAIALPLLAFAGLRNAPVDVFPEFMPPTVEIQTEALGLSASEVEHFITLGMEQDLLNGVPWLKSIHSTSMPGLSVVDLLFEPGTDQYAARQMVTERMTQARVLPNVGSAPVMMEPLASTSRIAMIGLSAKDVSLVDLSLLARWKIRPRLMGVPGVANVAVYGQRDRQIQVTVDPAKLHASKVTLTQVIETAGNSLWVSPLTFVEASTPGTGGFVESTNQRLAVQHISPISTPQQFAGVPVQDNPAFRLGDVTDVIEDHQPLIGDALVDGKPSLFLVIEKYPGTNTLEVTENIEEAMADMAPGLKGVTVTSDVYRPATFIQTALRNAGLVALLGFVLLILVLLLLLSSWRAALVAAVTVPIALIAAAYVLYLSGATFTTMTLVGLAVAVAFVIDDAVHDANGMSSRLHELPRGAGVVQRVTAAIEAGMKERGSALFATLVVLLATLPLLVMDSLTTSFTGPLVLTYALALAAAMLVALVLTPPLAVLVVRGGSQPEERPFARWVRRRFDGSLARLIARPVAAWAGVAVLLIAALAVLPQLGNGSVLPPMQDRNLLLRVQAAPGTSLTEMGRITGRLGQELRSLAGVLDVGVHVGRAVSSDQVVDTNSAELWVHVTDSADYAVTKAAVTTVAHGYPGLGSSLVNYADGKLRVAAGSNDDLTVRIYGIDLDTLQGLAGQVRAAIAGVPGLVAPAVRPVVQQPTVQIDVDVSKAQKYGLKPGDIRRDTTTLTSGLVVGNLYEQAKIFDVVVWGSPQTRSDLSGLQNLLLDTPSGGQVRLADVATVSIKPQPTQINHDEVLRDAEVVASVSGRDPNAVAADVKARIASVAMPYEYHAEVLGQAVIRQGQTRVVWWFAVGALIGILLLLHAASSSWRRSLVLLLSLPLSVVGGVLTAPLVGGVQAAGALAGLFAAFSLTVRGGVVLLRRIHTLEGTNGWAHDPAVVLEATRDQATPILQTAIAVALCSVPAAALGTRAGLEFLHPMAVTLLGALLSVVLVLLVVLPALLILVSPRRSHPSRDVSPEQVPLSA
jgi:Cu/Ag efflux pump CusA